MILLRRKDKDGSLAAKTMEAYGTEYKTGGDITEGAPEICIGVPLNLAE